MYTHNVGILKPFDFEYCSNKKKVFETYCNYSFVRTQSMFVYEGLPDTIPVEWLERYLQRNGSCCIAEHEGKLYALMGNAGGEYDEYYQPTKYTVANPHLGISKTYTIGEDCIYCKNDYEGIGLTPLISRYSGLMTENLLSIRISSINMRMMSLLSAPDDNTLQSTKKYLKDLEEGKLGVVGDSPFFEGVKVQPTHSSKDYMIQYIELYQYLKGSLYNELGINANFNMKREALSSAEVALNDDALMPLIDDMLKQRRAMCDALNTMFGLNVSVDFGSSWHSNMMEKQLLGKEELGADTSDSEELAGNASALPDDKDANSVDEEENDVSRLKEEEKEESIDNDNGENNSTSDDDRNDEKPTDDITDDEQSSETDDSRNSDNDSNDENVDEKNVEEDSTDEEDTTDEEVDEKDKEEDEDED